MMIWLSQFDLSVCQDLAITLVHFLWEGVAIAILTAALASVLRRQSSQSRYCVYLVAIALMAVCLPITLAVVVSTSPAAVESVTINDGMHVTHDGGGTAGAVASDMTKEDPNDGSSPSESGVVAATPQDAGHAASFGASLFHPASRLWRKAAPYVVAVYLLGLAIMLLRVGASLFGGHRLRCEVIAVDNDLLTAIVRVADRVGLRRVPLVAFCQRVSGPVVIGVMRPMVLLPITLTTGISPQQLEVVLTHEFVHVRRYDHLVLMFQRLIEAILFFHPAVWYISRRLSVERENCCDDAVVATGAPRVAYAELLLQLAERQMCGQTAPLSLAVAGDRPSQLRKRVARLVDPPAEPTIRLGRSGTILTLCLLAAMLLLPVMSLVLADPANPQMFVRSNATLLAFHDEIRAVIDESVKAVAVDSNANQNSQEKPAVFEGRSRVLASYLNASDDNREQETLATEIVENARVVILRYQNDAPTGSAAEDIAFARSIKGSWMDPTVSRSDGRLIPGFASPIITTEYSAIRAVFSKYYGAAQNLTPAEWLAEMKRPIAAGYKLQSITVFVTPPRDVIENSFAKAATAARSVARGLAAIKGDYAQLEELAGSHFVSGGRAKGLWPRFPGIGYRHDVGVNRKRGPDKLSDTWCQFNFGFGPMSGFPEARIRPSRKYPQQGIVASWSLKSGNDELKRRFYQMVNESLKELDALEIELAAKEAAAWNTD